MKSNLEKRTHRMEEKESEREREGRGWGGGENGATANPRRGLWKYNFDVFEKFTFLHVHKMKPDKFIIFLDELLKLIFFFGHSKQNTERITADEYKKNIHIYREIIM